MKVIASRINEAGLEEVTALCSVCAAKVVWDSERPQRDLNARDNIELLHGGSLVGERTRGFDSVVLCDGCVCVLNDVAVYDEQN